VTPVVTPVSLIRRRAWPRAGPELEPLRSACPGTPWSYRPRQADQPHSATDWENIREASPRKATEELSANTYSVGHDTVRRNQASVAANGAERTTVPPVVGIDHPLDRLAAAMVTRRSVECPFGQNLSRTWSGLEVRRRTSTRRLDGNRELLEARVSEVVAVEQREPLGFQRVLVGTGWRSGAGRVPRGRRSSSTGVGGHLVDPLPRPVHPRPVVSTGEVAGSRTSRRRQRVTGRSTACGSRFRRRAWPPGRR